MVLRPQPGQKSKSSSSLRAQCGQWECTVLASGTNIISTLSAVGRSETGAVESIPRINSSEAWGGYAVVGIKIILKVILISNDGRSHTMVCWVLSAL